MEKYTNHKLCEYSEYINGKTCAVIGVGVSNIPLINFLLERGAKVVARDKKSQQEISRNSDIDIASLKASGVDFITGEGYLDNITEQIVFKTPGIRCDNPKILEAYKNGSVVTSEMEVFLSLCPAKIIAITGSDGKTTTTTLTAKILEAAGKKVFLGGNIGKPLLYNVAEMTPDDFAVLELSSFQLHSIGYNPDGTEKADHVSFPDVAVITNTSPNHLDWHTDYDEYAQSKKIIYKYLRRGGKVVLNAANEITKAYAQELAECGTDITLFSAYVKTNGYFADESSVYKNGNELLLRSDIKLPGIHNAENYMAAMGATEDFVAVEDVKSVAQTFGGVEHRLEFVAESDGVMFYNSSIDSSPSRTIAAVTCFPEDCRKKLVLIMGGYDKNIPYAPIGEPVCRMAKAVFLCGATSQKIKQAIMEAENYDETTEIFTFTDFREAVCAAKEKAKCGDKVILTPASASFDMFRNFDERGKIYKAIVHELCGK